LVIHQFQPVGKKVGPTQTLSYQDLGEENQETGPEVRVKVQNSARKTHRGVTSKSLGEGGQGEVCCRGISKKSRHKGGLVFPVSEKKAN